jgi:hypothetical protein
MAEADSAEARTPQWRGRRTCANAADYLSGHRCGSSRPLGRGERRKAALRFALTEAVVNDPFASAGTKPLAER